MSGAEKFSYAISLRVHHPGIDPAEITRELNMERTGSWAAGSRRQTPAGTQLEGYRKETYWWVRLLLPQDDSIAQPSLEASLAEVVARLGAFRNFFHRVNKEGGRVTISIGIHGAHSYGFEFPPALNQQIGALGAAVLIDVYRDPQNW